MTDKVTEICAKIAAIGLGIPGINATGVFDPPPQSIKTANLPAMFTWTGPAQHSESALGENFTETSRTFFVQIAVIPVSLGDPNTRETMIRPLIEAALAQFRKYPRFKDVKFVESVNVGSDSGVVILPEYGGIYLGFEIPLEVTYITPRSYADGE